MQVMFKLPVLEKETWFVEDKAKLGFPRRDFTGFARVVYRFGRAAKLGTRLHVQKPGI